MQANFSFWRLIHFSCMLHSGATNCQKYYALKMHYQMNLMSKYSSNWSWLLNWHHLMEFITSAAITLTKQSFWVDGHRYTVAHFKDLHVSLLRKTDWVGDINITFSVTFQKTACHFWWKEQQEHCSMAKTACAESNMWPLSLKVFKWFHNYI